MKDRLLDKVRSGPEVTAPTEELDRPQGKRRGARERGLVCLTSTSLELGTFIPIGELSFGRGVDVDVQMAKDTALSRVHCRISKEKTGGFVVTDEKSRNGTFVNGARIDSAKLGFGDLLRLGDALFMYEEAPEETSDHLFIGVSAAMREVRAAIARVAKTDMPVLVIGETGTGKELVSQRVHELSQRKGPLIPVNAAAIPETLAESTLFGHVAGAFSGATTSQPGVFAQASGGTLFLDEIGELAQPLQAKLLRVLEGGDFSPLGSSQRMKSTAHVVAATNRDLRAGGFRPDLYARLAGAIITLPPLRARRIDVAYLAPHFLTRPVRVSAELMEALVLYDWPMNVRELRQRVQRMLLDAGDVSVLSIEAAGELASDVEPEKPAAPEPTSKEELEAVVRSLQGNVVQLAKHYGRTRKQIYRWAERFGLNLEDYR